MKVKEPSLLYYLNLAGGRIIISIPFPKCKVKCKDLNLTHGDNNHTHTISHLALAGPSGICAGLGIEINGKFKAERPPASAGPPLGG